MLRSVLALAIVCAAGLVQAAPKLDIILAHGTTAEQKARVQLQKLLTRHNVKKWVFTRKINIQTGQIPHSHPILTLNTRHLRRNDLFLSTFIHEQLHWYLARKEKATAAAVADLRRMYPAIPLGYPEGSADEESNYHHVIVTFLEYQAGKALFGRAGAKKVMDFWSKDRYTWIYKTMLADEAKIRAVLEKHALII